MAMKGINIFANLQTEFEAAQKGLKDVDDSIKKITGREPSGVVKGKSLPSTNRVRQISSNQTSNSRQNEHSINVSAPQIKDQSRKRGFGSAFSRFHGNDAEDETIRKPTLQSSVVATPREVKPRTAALEEQKCDKRNFARNKRIFGLLLGTLEKFKTEETQRKDTTQKRVEIEKKLDAAVEEERAAIRKERKELFMVRREKQAQIRRIEHKMERVEIHQEWEKSYQYFGNFIQTKTKPHIFYMPAKQLPETEKKLQETKDKFRLIVAEKRAKVQKELSEIDELYKKDEEMNRNEEMEMEDDEEMKENNDNNQIIDDEFSNNLRENSDLINCENDDKSFVKTEEFDHQTNVVTNLSEETSNGVNAVIKMECDAPPESLSDKEFEPIYDE